MTADSVPIATAPRAVIAGPDRVNYCSMHIRDIFQQDSTTFSFEFFPPRTDPGWETLFTRISDFEALGLRLCR